MYIPQDKKNTAIKIIKALLAEGYAAFFVGGCVRDIIMGNVPEDFDIATSANADEIIRLAEANDWKTVTVGREFGVIIVAAGGCQCEVSSFRADTYGQDSHRPSSVRSVERIEDDLARRDFTFNAMAIDTEIDGKIIDPFGGRADLDAKIIRTVGNPDERFAEDALRMFRAIRFAARFGFAIETATLAAISKNLTRVHGLSVERVAAEIEKILLSNHPAAGVRLLWTSGLAAQICRIRVKKEDFSVYILPELKYLPPGALALFANTPRRLTLRWAALLYLIALGMSFETSGTKGHRQTQPEPAAIEKALAVPARLKIKSDQIKTITWLLRNYPTLPHNRPRAVREWLATASHGFPSYQEMRKNLALLLALHKAGYKSSPGRLRRLRALTRTINKILRTFPFFAGQLAVTGEEIAAFLGFGRQVRAFQLDALAKIQKGELQNTHGDLLKALATEKAKETSQNPLFYSPIGR